jgi:hypothetical protein
MTRRHAILYLPFAVTVVIGLCKEVAAKCIVFTVVVDGRLHVAAKETTTIAVRVHANRGERISETRITPQENKFHAAIPFSTFASTHLLGGDNCSRTPTKIEVVLFEGKIAKQTVTLSLDRDFNWDARMAEWHVKQPVEL